MAARTTNQVLNQVLLVHNRSLARYLHDATPWFSPGEERAHETLELMRRDHEAMVDRLAIFITENGGVWDMGEYPMIFTAYHDVAFDWLLPQLLTRQEKMVWFLRQCVDQLRLAPAAKALVEEAVGLAKGHLESLQELTQPAKERPVVLAAVDHHADHGHHAGHH
ncbi:MAG TPA: hypothetical protein VL096_09765 [Pirellulaceae bacterium]|nr:hypothetical protein [Pirellulaceae bacterium]